ncbi:FtsJ-domain-containing protein [Meredithblackwellia eburnea MCA 4105]
MGHGGHEKKVGKGRLDKWYQLAKEQGYRARSAFKLVQLNKKYDFLSTARCVIDLCAAPGGWLQVAAKNMPPNSIIIGVDLVPIKPIPRVITLVEDITTEKCRRSLRAEVKDWKADVVLHDGAPNVGSAWVQDAFTQVELVLSSLKLATEFLTPGGTFCTKVFRSKDYNSLLWVFNQLFQKVEATKPPSSRNVSAEIFVVCQGYLAPAKIDPRLLQAKFVFSDLDLTASTSNTLSSLLPSAVSGAIEEGKAPTSKSTLTPTSLNVFHPEKKRRQRDGYEDGDLTLHKECGVMEFVRSTDPIAVLGLVGRLRWLAEEDKKLFKHPLTTPEIKAMVEDLKVLGKKDFKNLLKYRLAVREDLGIDVKVKETEELTEKVEVEPVDEEEQIAAELERLSKESALQKRKDRRKANEKRNREVQRMQLNMVTPMDVGLERHDGIDDGDVFDLGEVEGVPGKRRGVNGGLGEDEDDDDEDSGSDVGGFQEPEDDEDEDLDAEEEEERKTALLEASLDAAYDRYQQDKMERDSKHKAKEARRKRDAVDGGEWTGIKTGEDSEEDSDEGDFDPAPLPSDSEDDSDEEDGGMEVDGEEQPKSKRALKAAALAEARQRAKSGKLLTKLPAAEVKVPNKSRQAAMWFDQPTIKGMPGIDALLAAGDDDDEEDEDEDEDEDYDESDEEEGEGDETWNGVDSGSEVDDQEMDGEELEDSDEESDDDFTGAVEEMRDDSDMEEEADLRAQEEAEELKRQRIEKLGLTTAEAMSLAQSLVNRERTRTELIDSGFNRHTDHSGGDGLPTWFLDDEQKHFRNNVPITKEAVAAIREKQRALNARPIKKIAEAKARKKMRSVRRLEKMRAKAQGINDDEENGLTEKEKAASIAKVLSKGGAAAAKKPKREIKVVVARGLNRGQKGRPKGVKGRYKMVDPRMKGELRKMKQIKKRDRKSSGRRKNTY